jgi:hypothetical protein
MVFADRANAAALKDSLPYIFVCTLCYYNNYVALGGPEKSPVFW